MIVFHNQRNCCEQCCRRCRCCNRCDCGYHPLQPWVQPQWVLTAGGLAPVTSTVTVNTTDEPKCCGNS